MWVSNCKQPSDRLDIEARRSLAGNFLELHQMHTDPTAIDSPLALIALFVAIIELFLIYPITKLDGRDRSLLVGFVIGYPIFIAGAFFVFLWNKPVNLYKPQTLSENLQQALLPERLNTQLAPDRAAVVALEVKVTTLETQLRDTAQKIQGNLGTIPPAPTLPADFAKLSEEFNALKRDLLARAQAAGDVSPSGLASAARQVQTEEAKSQASRVTIAEERIASFKSWTQNKGVTKAAMLPVIVSEGTNSNGPSFRGEENKIILGPPQRDYMIPGLYINALAASSGYKGTFALPWMLSDYMASRFGRIKIPNPEGPYRFIEGEKKIAAKDWLTYDDLYTLFNNLSQAFGDDLVDAGVVTMINDWSSTSDTNSSMKSMSSGMIKAGAAQKEIDRIFGPVLKKK